MVTKASAKTLNFQQMILRIDENRAGSNYSAISNQLMLFGAPYHDRCIGLTPCLSVS